MTFPLAQMKVKDANAPEFPPPLPTPSPYPHYLLSLVSRTSVVIKNSEGTGHLLFSHASLILPNHCYKSIRLIKFRKTVNLKYLKSRGFKGRTIKGIHNSKLDNGWYRPGPTWEIKLWINNNFYLPTQHLGALKHVLNSK